MAFSHPKNNAIGKSIAHMTSRFASANDCVLFILVKLSFVLWDRLGGTFQFSFNFGAVNLISSVVALVKSV